MAKALTYRSKLLSKAATWASRKAEILSPLY